MNSLLQTLDTVGHCVIDNALPLRDYSDLSNVSYTDYEDRVFDKDGVVYPTIGSLDSSLSEIIHTALSSHLGIPTDIVVGPYLRLTTATTRPPNWAHTDEFCEYNLIGYFDNRATTHLVTHIPSETSHHPKDSRLHAITRRDANTPSKWRVDTTIRGGPNRWLIVNSRRFHAAGPGYGRDKTDGRIVLLSFFNTVRAR